MIERIDKGFSMTSAIDDASCKFIYRLLTTWYDDINWFRNINVFLSIAAWLI
jgi:hypothetical protein